MRGGREGGGEGGRQGREVRELSSRGWLGDLPWPLPWSPAPKLPRVTISGRPYLPTQRSVIATVQSRLVFWNMAIRDNSQQIDQ